MNDETSVPRLPRPEPIGIGELVRGLMEGVRVEERDHAAAPTGVSARKADSTE